MYTPSPLLNSQCGRILTLSPSDVCCHVRHKSRANNRPSRRCRRRLNPALDAVGRTKILPPFPTADVRYRSIREEGGRGYATLRCGTRVLGYSGATGCNDRTLEGCVGRRSRRLNSQPLYQCHPSFTPTHSSFFYRTTRRKERHTMQPFYLCRLNG